MKNLLIATSLLIISAHAFAGVCQKITSINEELNSEFWKNVSTISTIAHTAPIHEFQDVEILKDFLTENRCQKSMRKTIFTIKSAPGHIFESVISNDDVCDGGNAYGLIKDLANEKIIATVEDSYINCL